jgi:ATP-binding cassette subfamily B protein
MLINCLHGPGVPHRRLARARVAILREQLSQTRIRAGWILRLPASAPLWQQICDAGLRGSLFAPVALFLAQYLFTVLAWGLLGRRAFDGQFDYGWLIAWALLLLTAVPLQLVATWAQGRFSIGAAGLLKRKLLDGAMRLQPEEIRHKGAGQLLGEIIESSNVESLALNGGFLAIAAVVELIVAAIVLTLCGSGITLVVLLVGWVGVTCMLCRTHFRRSGDWSTARLAMTSDLVERMVGHRTRLAQETRERWHEGEDQVMEGYLDRSKAMDRAAVLQSLSARGWMVVGLLGLAPALISASSSAGALAIAIVVCFSLFAVCKS